MSTYSSGFTANIGITNTTSATINGWTLIFTLPALQRWTPGDGPDPPGHRPFVRRRR